MSNRNNKTNNRTMKEQEPIVAAIDIGTTKIVCLAGRRNSSGKIDILVNNAGITKDGLAARMRQDAWNLVLQINLSGAFLCTQGALPSMMKQRWGRIVNMASVVGQMGNP